MKYFLGVIVIILAFSGCINQSDSYQKLEEENIKLKEKNIELEKALVNKASQPLAPVLIAPLAVGSGYLDYTNSKHRFFITYPNGWKSIENYNPLIAFFTQDPVTNRSMNVMVICDETRAFDEVLEANKTEMKDVFPDISFASEKRIILNNIQGVELLSTFFNSQTDSKNSIVTYFFLFNNKSYIITFNTIPGDMPAYKAQIDVMIRSFKIGNSFNLLIDARKKSQQSSLKINNPSSSQNQINKTKTCLNCDEYNVEIRNIEWKSDYNGGYMLSSFSLLNKSSNVITSFQLRCDIYDNTKTIVDSRDIAEYHLSIQPNSAKTFHGSDSYLTRKNNYTITITIIAIK